MWRTKNGSPSSLLLDAFVCCEFGFDYLRSLFPLKMALHMAAADLLTLTRLL